jgi:hypothetical protein
MGRFKTGTWTEFDAILSVSAKYNTNNAPTIPVYEASKTHAVVFRTKDFYITTSETQQIFR